jgi:tRNA uridine 5-carboxymethylaminomethyl modification enzyme
MQLGPNEEVTGVTTFFGVTFRCKAAVLTTGTFMNGTIWVGRQSMSAGRCACAGRAAQRPRLRTGAAASTQPLCSA